MTSLDPSALITVAAVMVLYLGVLLFIGWRAARRTHGGEDKLLEEREEPSFPCDGGGRISVWQLLRLVTEAKPCPPLPACARCRQPRAR